MRAVASGCLMSSTGNPGAISTWVMQSGRALILHLRYVPSERNGETTGTRLLMKIHQAKAPIRFSVTVG